MADFQALYKAASANLSTLKQRNAREREARERRLEREKLERIQRREERQLERQRVRIVKEELRELTKECNRLDRKMMSKKGLTPEEHGAYEELDAMRWELVRQLTGEDWR